MVERGCFLPMPTVLFRKWRKNKKENVWTKNSLVLGTVHSLFFYFSCFFFSFCHICFYTFCLYFTCRLFLFYKFPSLASFFGPFPFFFNLLQFFFFLVDFLFIYKFPSLAFLSFSVHFWCFYLFFSSVFFFLFVIILSIRSIKVNLYKLYFLFLYFSTFNPNTMREN